MIFTERLLRIINNAEKEAERTTKIVYPVHLLLGISIEKTGVCCELNNNYPNLWEILNERVKKIQFNKEEQGVKYAPFSMNISLSTKQLLENASNRMQRFKQIFLNEGHLVDAIIKSNDPTTIEIIEGLDISRILEIIACPRDMIVSLKNYSFPNIQSNNLTYRKAKQSDALSLKNFVKKEFGNGWLDSIENGFSTEEIPIYIALDDNDVVGFACFDVVRRKKGLFGPMGTTFSNRIKGIGYNLLHFCLSDMKEIGYEYAIIGEAGPLEFYEKACKAVVIPKHL
ncbi:GNAT family N-acetyltransferase [Bacillus sp. OAE603]|uniref:GNAT family N-acetyltransferase n=1 Tax=Gottfriedia sp. OAE603 TaxID=2663872 RepID=UPI001789E975